MRLMLAAENSSNDRSRGATTLLELLTVVAIIGILLGLLLATGNIAQESVRRAQAKSDLLRIVSAIKAYQAEYGRFPISLPADGQATEVTYVTDNSDLFYTLRAIPQGANGQHVLNPRRIVFLEVANARDA